MGIAGFYLWLQRHYGDCVENITPEVVETAEKGGVHESLKRRKKRYDNLYLDMNGLIHPCCHDTAPLPEPETEEEMFDRIFQQIDILYKVTYPRKCLVLCIDGVAPRSKMNQQRSRRFRAAQERVENKEVADEVAEYIMAEHELPSPQVRDKWDHNVITPSTAFMERVGQSIEWFIMKKLNEDPYWKHITVVFSDAHVPGEGEHKIMHYIRGLRAQPGYDPNTSHLIHGMDADLICLGLSTHEPHFAILRNQLTEQFQPAHNKFCYFDLEKYRHNLASDFGNIPCMDFERVVDDFIFLCFFVGNDFLPHMPLISIKTRGIECLLDHYVREFGKHGYLTEGGEVKFNILGAFLQSFIRAKMSVLQREYQGLKRASDRARTHVEERIEASQKQIDETIGELKEDRSNSQDISNALLSLYSVIRKERLRFVSGTQKLGFSYSDSNFRDKYYQKKFGWDPALDREQFEKNVRLCCAEFLRGMQWVMRYYTRGCPSWEWFFPFHYTPLLEDVAQNTGQVDVNMKISAPLHPVEQLLAVLPRLSVQALPEELHEAVNDPTSVLGKFYPDSFNVDFSEANFAYQGIIQLPFINCNKLKAAVQELVLLEEDFGTTLLFLHKDNALTKRLEKLLEGTSAEASATSPVDEATVRICPIAGRVGLYFNEWPLHSRIDCPDGGVAQQCEALGAPIAENKVRCFSYEFNIHADYSAALLTSPRERRRKGELSMGGKRKRERSISPSHHGARGRDRHQPEPRRRQDREERDERKRNHRRSQRDSHRDRQARHRRDDIPTKRNHSSGKQSSVVSATPQALQPPPPPVKRQRLEGSLANGDSHNHPPIRQPLVIAERRK